MKIRRSKYRFRTLAVGDIRYVTGAQAKHAQQAWHGMRKRHPEIANRQFIWFNVNGGVKIERVG